MSEDEVDIYEYDDDLNNFEEFHYEYPPIQDNKSHLQTILLPPLPPSPPHIKQIKLTNSDQYFQMIKSLFQQQFQAAVNLSSPPPPPSLPSLAKLKHSPVQLISIQDILAICKTKTEGVLLFDMESVCCYLHYPLRKIHFFDIGEYVEQTFYQLNYGVRKKQSKKQVHIQMKISQIAQKKRGESYQDLQLYEYSANSIPEQTSRIKVRAEQNLIRKKNFRSAYYELFDFVSLRWVLVNSSILDIEDPSEMRETILEGLSIVQFYSVRRVNQGVSVTDLNPYFADDLTAITKRKKRIGCHKFIRDRLTNSKRQTPLQGPESIVQLRTDEIQLEYHLQHIPPDKKSMYDSDYFIVPSLIPKYLFLPPSAAPVGIFEEQPLYLKKDLVNVKSRMGWIDQGRKVKEGEQPLKKMENKSKKMTELFRIEQTEIYSLSISKEGDFLLDEPYMSIYVPPNYIPPPPFVVIQLRVGVVARKGNIRHGRLVSGFSNETGKYLPNEIGTIIYEEDRDTVLRLHEERQKVLEQNKEGKKIKELEAKWRKIFKTIDINEEYMRHY